MNSQRKKFFVDYPKYFTEPNARITPGGTAACIQFGRIAMPAIQGAEIVLPDSGQFHCFKFTAFRKPVISIFKLNKELIPLKSKNI
jgi:hypothetical protein